MQCRVIGVLVLIGTLGTGLLPLNARASLTVSVMPDKILYAPGATAKFDVTVVNGTKESVKAVLAVKVIWEMDDSVKVKEASLELSPGETKVIRATWKTADVLGCEVRANLTNGTNLVATAAEYFNVCPAKDAQRVGIHVEIGGNSFPDKEYLDTIPALVASLRLGYGNLVEHFGWSPDHYAELAPRRDEWCNWYWGSKAAVRKAIQEEHKHGMKALSYACGFLWSTSGAGIIQRHPDQIFWHEDGQPWGDVDVRKLHFTRNPDRRAYDLGKEGGSGLGHPLNFAGKPALEYGVQQLIESKQMFDWDGVRFDGHFVMWNAELNPGAPSLFPGARDSAGKVVVTGEKAAAITRANTAYTRRTIAARFPDYLFMFNGYAQECDIQEICRDGGAVANELIRSSSDVSSRWNNWKAFAQYLLDDVATAAQNGGYAYAYMNPPWAVCPNVDRLQYAVLFAAGNHPWFPFPTLDRKSDVGGSHYPIQKDYFRFATRFSAALWGRGIERVKAPEALVDVTSPQGAVWWKDFVQRRPLVNGRHQLVVHLINEPPTPNMLAESQALPAPVKNITVKFKQPVARVWLATSQPELSYRLLPVDHGTVNVPELNIWSMVIAEVEGK